MGEHDSSVAPTASNQRFRQQNIEAITAYYKRGIKRSSHALGIEVEHFITNADGSPVPYSGEHGVAWLLEQLSETYPERTYGSDNKLIGVAKPGATVTLEPGAQLELSAGPFENLAEAKKTFEQFLSDVASIIAPYGMSIEAYGYRPTGKACDIELIPKARYDYMNSYFEHIGPYGTYMMRGSAATQVSIDYYSVEDCLKKLRIASACAPLFALICDNTPVFEGEKRTHPVMRSDVWLYCDPDRTGTVPGVLSEGFSLEDYASFVLDAPAILVPDGTGYRACTRTFGEEYANRAMSQADVEHALSMFFTDARLKTYIEIRPADSMKPEYVTSYAALIKGLFYNGENVDYLSTWAAAISESDVAAAKSAVAAAGYNGTVYGKPAFEQVDMLFSLAVNGLDNAELAYLKPLADLAQARTTLADKPENRWIG